MGSKTFYTEEQQQRVVSLFRTLEDNTIRNLTMLTGISKANVNKILDKHLKQQK